MGAAAPHATTDRGTVQPRGDGRRRAKASTVLAAAANEQEFRLRESLPYGLVAI